MPVTYTPPDLTPYLYKYMYFLEKPVEGPGWWFWRSRPSWTNEPPHQPPDYREHRSWLLIDCGSHARRVSATAP